MWPKMLFEVLPHVGRLVPMAERFLETRKAREQEEQAQLATISETLHTELGRVAETQAGFQRALKDQAEQVNAIAVETTRARMAVESIEGRLSRFEAGLSAAETAAARAEKAAAGLRSLFLVVVVLLITVAALLGWLVYRVEGR